MKWGYALRIFAATGLTTRFAQLLLVSVALSNIFVIALAGVSLEQSRRQYEAQAMLTTNNLAKAIGRELAGIIARSDLALLAVIDEYSRLGASDGGDAPQKFSSFIARQHERHSYLEALRVADAQGTVVNGDDDDINMRKSQVSVADRNYFIHLREHPESGLHISEPVKSRITGRQVITFARRINGPGSVFAGIAYAVMSVDKFTQTLSEIDTGYLGSIALRDARLGVIARYARPAQLGDLVGNAQVPQPLRALVASGAESGAYHAVSPIDGIERSFSYRKIAGFPLHVTVAFAADDYLAQWRREVIGISGAIGLFVLISTLLSLSVYRNWQRQKLAANDLEQQVMNRTAQLSAMSLELTMAEDRERHDLAQVLHDDVAQLLAMSKLKLSALCQHGREQAELSQEVKQIEIMIDQANQSVRSLSLQLSPPMLDQLGLISALEWLGEEMQRINGLKVRIHDDGRPKPIGKTAGLMLFRAVRELLMNVSKHAQVDTADVTIAVVDERLVLSVSDSGAGFSPLEVAQPTSSGGYGLFSIRERISHVGGEVQIDSHKGDGTVAVLILPMTRASY